MKVLKNLILFLLLSISIFAAKEDYFVSTTWLNKNLDKDNILILDARGNKKAYSKGHIPGAILTSWPAFAKMDGKPSTNKVWGTLKDKSDLERSLQEVGLNNNSKVVVYTDPLNGFGEGARLVWMLKYVGLEDVRLLDGGIEAWKNSGGKTTREATKATLGDITVDRYNRELIISTSELSRDINNYSILDVREAKEYQGRKDYGEAKRGRIPTAKNIYYKDFLDKDGLLKSKSEVSMLLSKAGVDTSKAVVPYCTGGIRSSLGWIALAAYDYTSKNYDSSFAGWILAGNEIEK